MIAYTIKNNCYKTNGFCPEFLARQQERSYIKDETDLDRFQQLVENVKRVYNGPEPCPDLDFLCWVSRQYYKTFKKPISRPQADKILYSAGILTDKMLVHQNFRTYLDARVHDFPDTDLRMRHMFPDESISQQINNINHILEQCPIAEEDTPDAGDGK